MNQSFEMKSAVDKVSSVGELRVELERSMRRPGRKTLALIDKALSYLTPFESPLACVASGAECGELLDLICTHRRILCPYIDVERVESNLRGSSRKGAKVI